MVDLHTHSTCSDGSLSPVDLIDRAAALGLDMIALTDHDTVDGNSAAASRAAELGLAFVAGVELDVDHAPGELHLLGLGLREEGEGIRPLLAALLEARTHRNYEIVERMNRYGIPVRYPEVSAFAGGEVVGRLHFASYLVKNGHCSDIDAAFRDYLGPDKPFYVKRRRMTLEEAIPAVHASGGKAVLAHPASLRLGWEALGDRIGAWATLGLDGVEAYHPNSTCRFGRRMERLAAEAGLFVTAGSDFHGEPRRDRRLGRTCDGRKIDDRFGDPFRSARLAGRG